MDETALFAVHCERCGEVRLPRADVRLRVCSNDPSRSVWSFVCPDCGERKFRNACEHAIKLLTDNGATVETYAVPAEVLEPKRGPVLTHDDLLDFHLQLERFNRAGVSVEVWI